MSKWIDKLNRHHGEIRRNQLDCIFKQRRMLMQTVTGDVKNILSQCLESIKTIYIEQQKDFEALQQMTLLHTITRDYACCDILCQLVPFAPTEIKCELVSMNLTWLDLLLLILKETWETSNLTEEVSAVIADSSHQLSLKLKQAQEGVSLYQQLKRILEGYPFELLKEGSPAILINTLDVVSSIVKARDGSVVYNLLNKTKPSILKQLNTLYKRQELMEVKRVKEYYLSACLSIASMVNRYHLQHIDNERFQALSHNLNTLVLEMLKKSQSKEQFTLACSQLILICKIWKYYPEEQDFSHFQTFISREIQEQNQIYFNLLRLYVNFSPYKLTSADFRELTAYLFHEKHQYSKQKKISLRVTILSIMKAHIINCGNHILQADIQSFMSLWGESALTLSELAEDLYYQSRDNMVLLFEVLSFIIAEAPEAHQLVTEGYLFHLVKYAEFRKMLRSLGYELDGESEDQEWIDL